MDVGLSHYLILSAILFGIGLMGMVLNRNNLIAILMCLELMLLASNINFVAIGQHLSQIDGQVLVFFILAISACEAAVGLAIFVQLYRSYQMIDTDKFDHLRG